MINPNDPSYPHASGFHDGISIRTYIATKAMQGYCSHYEYAQMDYDKLANAAVKQADALIKRLNEEQ